jgi:gamma-glutamyltranspeptidase
VVQTLANYLFMGLPLRAAVEHPRLHVELTPGVPPGVAHEEGLPLGDPGLPVRRFPPQAMFFGGVNAALLTAGGEIELVSDPRRRGGTAVS